MNNQIDVKVTKDVNLIQVIIIHIQVLDVLFYLQL